MSAPTTYVIRRAGPEDSEALYRIARLDTQRPLAGDALIGEIGGVPAAAISLADGRVIADPFIRTAGLAALLRLRHRAARGRAEAPALLERLLAGLRTRPPAHA